MRRTFCYLIVFLAVASLFPVTPRTIFSLMSRIVPITPWAAEVEKRGNSLTIPSVAEAETIVTIDPEMIYIGDDGRAGLVYQKEFTLGSVGSENILSLRIAGMVAVRNDNDSKDYHIGFYTNKLYINDNYIDNLNNYVYQEEDKTFRTVLVPLPSHVLRPGLNKLIVVAKGPKNGNHDDFALDEIKLLQRQ